jgi:hypothetical protein
MVKSMVVGREDVDELGGAQLRTASDRVKWTSQRHGMSLPVVLSVSRAQVETQISIALILCELAEHYKETLIIY